MKFTSSQGNNKNLVVLSIVTLLSIAILIFSCITIAGTSGNHLTSVYLGEADIRHINVSKILPSIYPVIALISKALTVGNTTQVYSALESLGNSPALRAILDLITESKDADKTIDALTTLGPLVVSSNNTAALTDVVALINNANNSTLLFDTITSLGSSSDSSTLDAITPVIELISNSNNVTATLTDLVVLSEAESYLPAAELEAVLSLIAYGGSNVTATLGELAALSTASKSLNIADEASIFIALMASYNKTQVLEGLISESNSTAETSAFTSLYTLLNSSANSTATLVDVATILLAGSEQNSTQLQISEESILSVASLLENSINATETMALLPVLVEATAADPTASTTALTSFINVLKTSKNSTLTLELLSNLLTSSDSSDSTSALIELLDASSNVNSTLTNLVSVATLAQTNASSITPLLSIMKSSGSSSNISDAYIYENVLPTLMDNMKFATNYKMGIFSLCKYNTKGELYYCTKSHAVQSFIMKDILFNELEESSFSPFVKALDLTKDDIIIVGELPKKQHLYVPGLRAILAFAILAIIASVVVPVLFITGLLEKVLKLFFTPLLVVNALLVGIITAAIGGLVKHGLKHDKYNVTWKIGAAVYALSWIAFVFAAIVAVVVYLTLSKNAAPSANEETPEIVEEQEVIEEQEIVEEQALREDLENTETSSTNEEIEPKESEQVSLKA
ncbi:hypothetical protein QEN19_002626 [Hanseniaspora menglaensis]